ncbi:hypothetical protein YTPLAS18_25470 [Nitrospira sp.]|nr:hypothetical protein YTPLAS18_25470 [Nitrospira sp.]
MLKKKLCASWDRFLIPFPFSRGLFIWGRPIVVRSDADSEELEARRRDLQDELNRITAEADATVLT